MRREHTVGPENERVDPVNVVRRKTEHRAMNADELDHWMQRRIAYFGEAGLTLQEYRAVTYSLHGLPVYAFDGGRMNHAHSIEQPTQKYVATKMSLSHQRVSQLLEKAGRAMDWFDQAGRGDEVHWERQGKRGWHLVAPVLGSPVAVKQTRVRIVRDRTNRSYKLAFAGDL